MPLKNKADQTADAIVLRDATVPEENTALRVYNLVKNLIDSAIFYDQVKQITGSSTTDVMSQKAVTDALAALSAALIGTAPIAGNTLGKLYDLIVGIGQFVGGYDASGGALPTTGTGASGAIDKGDYWLITVGGTIPGLGTVAIGDVLFAEIANAAVAADFFYLPFATLVANASETVKGIVEEATTNEVRDGNSTGGTGAKLFVTPEKLLAKLAINREITAATGATLQTDNQGKVYFNRPTAITFTIDELDEGSEITFINVGAGTVTFVNGTGVVFAGIASLPGASADEFPAAQIFYKNPTAPMIISGGGGSVETVTGGLVDNTDPDNPIINNPTISDVTGLTAELARIENLIGNSEL